MIYSLLTFDSAVSCILVRSIFSIRLSPGFLPLSRLPNSFSQPKNSAPFNATVFKASAGLAEYLDVYVTTSAEIAAQELKKAGYTLYLASFAGENAITCKYTSPLCLVVGGEGFGISKQVYKYGTEITLPQKTSNISYNVSVAAGILLFIVATQFKRI